MTRRYQFPDSTQSGLDSHTSIVKPADPKTDHVSIQINRKIQSIISESLHPSVHASLPPTTPVLGNNLGNLGEFHFKPDVEKALAKAAKANDINLDALRWLVMKESNGNPNSVSTAGYTGLGQLSPKEFKLYGQGGNIKDPFDNAMATAAKMRADAETIKKTGTVATLDKIYSMHLNGPSGAKALAEHPDIPAWQALFNYTSWGKYGKGGKHGRAVAQSVIRRNLPDALTKEYQHLTITSQQFTEFHTKKVGHAYVLTEDMHSKPPAPSRDQPLLEAGKLGRDPGELRRMPYSGNITVSNAASKPKAVVTTKSFAAANPPKPSALTAPS